MPTPVAWSPAFGLNTRQADSQPQVRLVQLRNGDFWLVWTDNKDSGAGAAAGTDVVGQRYSSLGEAQGGEVALNAGLVGDNERNAHLAADVGSNAFFVVFEDRNAAGDVDIILERKNGDGGFGGVPFVRIADDPTNDDTGIDYRNPRVAVASAASGLVVFESTDDAGNTDIFGRLFIPNTLQTGTVFPIADDIDDLTDPQIVATSDGRYAMVWTDERASDPATTDIRGAFITQGGAISPFLISFDNALERDPSVAALDNGRIVVTWTQGDNIVGVIFEANATILVPQFTIAGSASVEGDSRVVRTGPASFVVAWENTSSNTIAIAAYTLQGTSVTQSGVTTIAAGSQSVSDLSLIGLADGRVLVGYDNPLARAQIFDPRAAVNDPAVYAPADQQIGTVGNDVFTAAANADLINGWDGDDVITDGGGTEADYFGGAGNDTIRFTFVDAGERANGGTGTDTLVYLSLAGSTVVNLLGGTATTGATTQSVLAFENFFTDQGQNVTVIGTDAPNVLTTGSGNDILDGFTGADILTGGFGDDRYFVDQNGDVIVESAGAGNDRVFVTASYVLTPGAHIETLMTNEDGGMTPINLTGNELAQSIIGNAGANVLRGGGGADSLSGLGGNDFFFVDSDDLVYESVGGGFDRLLSSTSYALRAGAEVELFTTDDNSGTDAINFTGNEFGQSIFGNNGPNTFIGGGGQDSLSGFGGNDFYFVDSDDLVYEIAGGGFDRLLSSTSYRLRAGAEVELFTTNDNFGTGAIDFAGNEFGQSIFGNDGANVLRGGGGLDSLSGFGGNDFYFVDGDDLVYEVVGGGFDRLLSSTSYTLRAGAEVELFTTNDNFGTSAIDFTGNEFGQSIFGNNAVNTFVGGGGQDSLSGFGGNDFYFVDSDDLVYEAAGGGFDRLLSSTSYILRDGAEVELFTTENNFGTAAINFTGNEFAQSIYGNDAPNVLDGKAGADDLIGFGGNDTFAFTSTLSGGNVDLVYGFVSGQDRVALDDAVFGALTPGALPSGAFVAGTAAQDADDRILFDAATGRMFYDPDGSGGGAAVHFATLTGGASIAASDFLVI